MYKFISKNYIQYVATFTMSIYSIAFGFTMSWSSPVLPQLQSDNSPIGVKVDLKEGAWITSLLLLGIVFGYAVVGPLMDRFGRKFCLLASVLPVVGGWLMIYFANSVEILYAARILHGILHAFPIAVSVIYIAEIAEPAIRGKLGIFNLMMIEVGMAIVQTVGNYVSYHDLAIICAVVPVIFFFGFIWMPESPYYYLRRDDMDSARASLIKLRGKLDVEKELMDTHEYVKQEMNSTITVWDLCKTEKYRKQLLIVMLLKAMQQISGSVAIISYMKTIFEQTSSGLDANVSTTICTALPLPIMIVASYIVDRGGRRPLYFASTLGCAVGLFCEFIYFFLQDYMKQNVRSLGWMPITGIFVFYAFRSIGITPIPYIVLSELFPTNIKGKAVSLCLVFGGLLAFLVTLYFPLFADSFGMYTAFAVFTIVCVVGLILTYIFLPETKGKSFAAIQIQLDEKKLNV